MDRLKFYWNFIKFYQYKILLLRSNILKRISANNNNKNIKNIKKMSNSSYKYWLDEVRSNISVKICREAKNTFDIDNKIEDNVIINQVSKALAKAPKGVNDAIVALPCFALCRFVKKIKPPVIAEQLAESWSKKLSEEKDDMIVTVTSAGPYLNFDLNNTKLVTVLDDIISGNMLNALPKGNQEKVMIEYSQPNTHKAFHVGHMRNAALGDCLVRFFEFLGHEVIAANYFGDEGAHVAKCVWYLKRFWLDKGHSLDEIDENERGEFLGSCYSKSVNMLDLKSMTKMPYPNLIAAQIVSVNDHPAEDAPKNWHVVEVKIKDDDEQLLTVVCGGEGYKIGDKVAYAPVGIRFANKNIVPKDMKGVVSNGIMVGYREVGLQPPLSEEEKKAAEEEDASSSKSKKKKKKKNKKNKAGNNKIYILPDDIKVGANLVDYGRLSTPLVPDDVVLSVEYANRLKEVQDTLRLMEERSDEELNKLWDITKEWSLTDFRKIYKWLNVRFDHEFFESEVSEESRNMVIEYENSEENKEKQVLVRSNGALGANLDQCKPKLGFCMVLKSNGAGLYATKDLALAKRKFNQFNIEKSIYVIDAAQTLHCQQVFKVLELMGFEQAKKCYHLAYGQVVLPSGKMSSRTGTVVLFSDLKKTLYEHIYNEFLKKYENTENEAERWSDEQIQSAKRAIALATIKYGMLKTSPANDIVFEMDKWTAKSGDTGPYILYTFARINKILSDITPSSEAKLDYDTLSDAPEKAILIELNEFRNIIEKSAQHYNPATLTHYLFNLSQMTSAWYELPGRSVKNAESNQQLTRLKFLQSIAAVIEKGLWLLGIEVIKRM